MLRDSPPGPRFAKLTLGSLKSTARLEVGEWLAVCCFKQRFPDHCSCFHSVKIKLHVGARLGKWVTVALLGPRRRGHILADTPSLALLRGEEPGGSVDERVPEVFHGSRAAPPWPLGSLLKSLGS